jgi:hypothetical protein
MTRKKQLLRNWVHGKAGKLATDASDRSIWSGVRIDDLITSSPKQRIPPLYILRSNTMPEDLRLVSCPVTMPRIVSRLCRHSARLKAKLF